MKPGPRPAGRDTPQRGGPALKQKILDVAMELFARKGFAGTRISDIAERAGAEAPTIYHYFGNKRDLYHAVCRACFIDKSNESQNVLQSDGDPAERVFDHVFKTGQALIQDRTFYLLLQRQLLELDGHEMHAFVEDTFENGLREFRAALDVLQPGGNNGRLGMFIYCVMFGASRLSPMWESAATFDFPEARDPRLLTERVLSLFLPHIDWSACGRTAQT